MGKQITKVMETNNYSYNNDDISNTTNLLTTDLRGIFGLPYQFLETVDDRITNTEMGIKYAEKIITRMPLLFLVPCEQEFVDAHSKEDISALISGIAGDTSVAELLNDGKTARYYTTKFAYDSYFKIVSNMCTAVASFLGIADKQVYFNNSLIKIKDIKWEKAKNSDFNNYLLAQSTANPVVFYLDGLDSVSESFGNSTMESSLASTINGFSDQAKEITFLLGNSWGADAKEGIKSSLNDGILGNLANGLGKVTQGTIIEKLISDTSVSSILDGAKIVFPKLWSDASFDRSYSFSIKLRSPDHDDVSIFFNVLVPYIHLLALALPKGLEDDPNSYKSPFLVRAYCKGMFNIDMGLISNMSVTRGATAQWNDNGIPTQIDVEMSIEDLYSALYLTDSGKSITSAITIASNTGMMDYLCNLAGLNLADMEFTRIIKMTSAILTSDVKNLGGNIWTRLDTAVNNEIWKFIDKFV